MSQTIKTYKDLCEERERLQLQLVAHKQRVKDDWRDLKSELSPVKSAFGLVGKMTHADRSNPLVNAGLKIASDLFLKNFILAKAGWATRLAVPFVMKNFSSHMLVEKGAGILDKVGNLFKKKRDYKPFKSTVMDEKDNKVVNTEEQNRAVNPGTADFSENSFKENVGSNQSLTDVSRDANKRTKPEPTPRAED